MASAINAMKEKIKKNDALYGVYLFFVHRKVHQQKKQEKRFYKRLITPGSLVFDIGANIGNKSKLFAEIGSSVISIEPDTTNYELLSRRFKSNKSIKVLPFAVSNTVGTASFYMLEPGSAFNTLNVKWKETLEDAESNRWHDTKSFQKEVVVKTTTIDQLIKEFGKPGYIKIDVEGNELLCIKGLSECIDIISFEANLPEFKSETLNILDHLNGIDPKVKFNYMRHEEVFAFPEHLPYKEFYRFLESTDIRYMDIVSFMKN